jgi:uridine kinase
MEIPESLLNAIKTLKHPAIVAVSGLGGSGKSSLAKKLGELLDAPVVGVDSFQKKGAFDTDFSLWEIMDYLRLEREVLAPFLKGENASYGHFDASQESISHTVEIANVGLLIVEGVGLFRPELLKHFSYKVWVETPMEVAIARGKRRDREEYGNPADEQWEGVWKKNDLEYLETFKPQEMADFVFQNR